MIIYEVNIKISPQIYNEYISWLEKHITLMMEHEGFIKYNELSLKLKQMVRELKKNQISDVIEINSNNSTCVDLSKNSLIP